MSLRETIISTFHEVLEDTDSQLLVDKLSDEVILLESGLDSLGFAILVATLDEKLDLDPFAEMEDAVYPSTFGEFVAIYENAR